MLSRILDDILGPHSKISVLRVLFVQDELSGREVARRAGLSPRAASQALAGLVRAGVLRRRAVGAAHSFSVDRRRHLVRAVLGKLFAEEEGLPGAIGREITRMLGPRGCSCVAIFGSYARGQGTPQSDLDVLVLLKDAHRVPRVKALLQERGESLQDRFGLHLSPYVLGAAEFTDRFEKGDKLARSLVREARVVAGKPLAEVLADESQERKD